MLFGVIRIVFARIGVWGGRHTRVDERTVFRRGKSEIPESRIEIEESRRESELRNEVTDALSEARDCDVVIVRYCTGLRLGTRCLSR